MEVRIQTVCGNIAAGDLGFCHSHDHIMVAKGKSFEIDPALCIDDYEKSLDELNLFKSVGGGAIVDCQPVGAGRMSAELVNLSAQSNVHIVASTGFHKMAFYEDGHWIFSFNGEQMEEIFVHELTHGMYTNTENTPPSNFHTAKAGAIKVAYDIVGLTSQYIKLFKAAAAAQKKTNAPMIIHIDNGCNPLILDDFLTECDIAHQKRIYCHLDRAVDDINIHIELCKRGSYVEYDTIHRLKYHSDTREIAIIKCMLDAGFSDRILLGLDSTSKRLKAYGGEPGLDYIKTLFIPMMETEGIKRHIAEGFMLINSAKAFAY